MRKLSIVCAFIMTVNTCSLLSSFQPFSLITISFRIPPKSYPIFSTLVPISIIKLSIVPLESTLSFSHIVHKNSCKNTIVCYLYTFFLFIVVKLTLENEIFSNKDTFSFSILYKLSKIYSILTRNDLKSLFLYYLFQIKSRIHRFIVLNKFFILTLFRNFEFSCILIKYNILLFYFTIS